MRGSKAHYTREDARVLGFEEKFRIFLRREYSHTENFTKNVDDFDGSCFTLSPAHAGVGWSEYSQSQHAMEHSGGAPDLLLIFATSRHDAQKVHAGLREVVAAAPRIVGGSAIGVLTNDKLGYDGYQLGVAALRWGAKRKSAKK